ncbi:hypothetical protein ACWE42_10760 [Sutcliffiella cohnii]
MTTEYYLGKDENVMYQYQFQIEDYRVGKVGKSFNHISVPVSFDLLIGGKWMNGTVFYHHYHRTITFDPNLSQILKHIDEAEVSLMKETVFKHLEKEIKGLALSQSPLFHQRMIP